MKVIIAGGTGAIGTALISFLLQRNHQVILLSRKDIVAAPRVHALHWDGEHVGPWKIWCENADIIINLCGKSVNCRYTEKNKLQILRSRLRSTRAIGKLIQSLERPPAVWLNASSATIYEGTYDGPQDEITGVIGSDFSMDVCRDWEAEAMHAVTPSTNKILMRTSIVLDPDQGALPLYKRIAKMGFGGRMGSGEQMMSWIHIDDLCRAILFLATQQHISGPVNITSPYAITNTEFMQSLCRAMHIPVALPNPEWMLQLGTAIIGTEMELIMKSRWVYPQRLLEAGFTFSYPNIEQALADLLADKSTGMPVPYARELQR